MSEFSEQPRSGYSEFDEERWVAEPPKSRARTPFERDRARIVHSSALRRLGAKTQILGAGADDFVRTRLTHSLEVAQVGRELGKALGCDPDVVDSACLAHDLGHPPFGHNGERVLNDLAVNIGGFEGNAQTLRLLTRLEPKVFAENGHPVGLNLTRAALDAATKYPWSYSQRPVNTDGTRTRKFGVYDDDLPVFTWIRQGAPLGRKCLEAQVMDLADDISYSVHDVEDHMVGGRIDLGVLDDPAEREHVIDTTLQWYSEDVSAAELSEAVDRLVRLNIWPAGFDGSRRALASLKDFTSQMIGRFARAAQQATRAEFGEGPLVRYRAELIVPQETRAEILVLKGLAATYVMSSFEMEPVYQAQKQLITELVEALTDRPEYLEPIFRQDWRDAHSDAERLRIVIDQVASLTDLSARTWHQALKSDGFAGEAALPGF